MYKRRQRKGPRLAIASGGAVDDPVAALRPDRRSIFGFPMGEQRDLAGCEIVAVVLIILIATRVFAEDEIVSSRWLIGDSARSVIIEEGHLCACPGGGTSPGTLAACCTCMSRSASSGSPDAS